jgi:hypothetical protein
MAIGSNCCWQVYCSRFLLLLLLLLVLLLELAGV